MLLSFIKIKVKIGTTFTEEQHGKLIKTFRIVLLFDPKLLF